jgi:hypothetical protein
MTMGRKGAFLLLAVVVFWTALPASACLLARNATARPACCHAMKDCDSPMMGADNSCCQMHGSNAAVVTILPYSLEDHAPQLIAMPYQFRMEMTAAQSSGYGDSFETPPPKFPPGGAFALRI